MKTRPVAKLAALPSSLPPSPVCVPQARELEELAQIYVQRGLPYDLARQVSAAQHGMAWRAPCCALLSNGRGPGRGEARCRGCRVANSYS